MPVLGSDGGGGLKSLQKTCLYQTVIRLILIREYLCLNSSCGPQAARQQEPWQLKIGNCHPPSPLHEGKTHTYIQSPRVIHTLLEKKQTLCWIKHLLDYSLEKNKNL